MADRSLRFNIFADDRASRAFDSISRAVERVSSRLTVLDGKRVKARIEADTARVEQAIDRTQARLTELNSRRTQANIDSDSSEARADLAALQASLERLNRGRFTPEIDLEYNDSLVRLDQLEKRLEKLRNKPNTVEVVAAFGRTNDEIQALYRRLQQIDQMRADPEVRLEIGQLEARITQVQAKLAQLDAEEVDPEIALETAGAMAELAALQAALKGLRDEKVRVEIEEKGDFNSLLGTISRLHRGFVNATNASAQFTRSLRVVGTPVALSGLLPVLASIGATLEDIIGLAGLIPGAVSQLGIMFGTLMIGFRGFKDAFGTLDTDRKIEKYNLALSKMGEEAKKVVLQIRGMGKAWDEVRKATQNALFDRMSGVIKNLGTNYLPLLKKGFQESAAGLNFLFRQLGTFLTLPAQVKDIGNMFDLTERSVRKMTPAIINVVAAFNDLAVVGGSFMPGLMQSFSNLTARFRNFIETSRKDGSLDQWIARGITAFNTLGRTILNVGHVFGDMFDAARIGGGGVVEAIGEIAQAIHEVTSTNQGQSSLIAFFTSIRQVIDNLKPGFKNLLSTVGGALQTLQPVFANLATLVSNALIAIAPTITIIADRAVAAFTAVSGFAGSLVAAIGPVVPYVLALAVSFKSLALVAGTIGAIGTRFAAMAGSMALASQAAVANANAAGTAVGAYALAQGRAATTLGRFATIISGVGRAIPLVGIAILGLVMAYDALNESTDEVVDSVVRGETSMAAAVAKRAAEMTKGSEASSRGAEAHRGSISAAEAYAKAEDELRQALEERLGAMGPVQRAQLEMTLAENSYHAILDDPALGNAGLALEELKRRKEDLNRVTKEEARLQETATEALIRGAREARAAYDADYALEGAKLRVTDAVDRVADALKKGGKDSQDYKVALHDLRGAYDDVANAAGTKAAADAEAAGSGDGALKSAQAQRDAYVELAKTARDEVKPALADQALQQELLIAKYQIAEGKTYSYKDALGILAATASGPTKTAIDSTTKALDAIEKSHKSAEDKARLQKDELIKLAGILPSPLKESLLGVVDVLGQEAGAHDKAESAALDQLTQLGLLSKHLSTEQRPQLDATIKKLGEIQGSHMTAGEKADAQKRELQKLADIMPEPVRGEILRMIGDLNKIPPEKAFKITAQGELAALTNHIAQGGKTLATGGVLDGYTPGRDVHDFYSPTAGSLHLSGGEAVMRPEWTRAMGKDYVDQANEAARMGGVGGVTTFLKQTVIPQLPLPANYATGGILPGQRLAGGGFVQTGSPPISTLPSRQAANVEKQMLAVLLAKFKEEQKKYQASLAALGAGMGGPGKYQAMFAAIKQVFPFARLISGFRPGARTHATGNLSYHASGRAVDVTPDMRIFNWIRGTYGAGIRELIFSPANGAQVWNGRPHMYTGVTRADHWDHVHWAMKKGGILGKLADRGGMIRSGQAGVNLSGRAERMLTGRQNDAYERMVAVAEQNPSSGGSPDVVQAIHELMGVLRGGGNTYNNTFPITGGPKATAAEVAKAQRLQAALGAWGNG